MQHLTLELVFEGDTVDTAYVEQLCGPMPAAKIGDCTVARIKFGCWTPPAGIRPPPSLVGGVLVFDAGGDLSLLAATFPHMRYKLDESATQVTAAFSRRDGILHPMTTQLLSVHLHFLGPVAVTAWLEDVQRFIDTLLVDTEYDCTLAHTPQGVDYLIALKIGQPWKFADNRTCAYLEAAEFVYLSPGQFDRIHTDIVEVCGTMDVRHSMEGDEVRVMLQRPIEIPFKHALSGSQEPD